MEEIYELVENKRIFVRKKIANFLEKLFRHCGYDFDHDVFKKIIYSEEEYKTPIEEKIKHTYDTYIYLLHNDKSRISKSFWKRVYYLYKEEEVEEFKAIRLCTKYFHMSHMSAIEQAIEYHMIVYEEFKELKEEERLILSLMLYNYMLARNQIPIVQLFKKEYEEYEKAREAYLKGNKVPMLEFSINLLKKNPYMEKNYYKKLRPISLKEIVEYVEGNKEELKQKFHIKGLWIHGSIAKKIERMDSDIDLFIELSLDLLQEEKQEILKAIKQELFTKFERMIDLHELVEYVEEEIIKEIKTTKKII
ncbi:MAG: hypothetical protein HFG90_08265 [Acholeplasmatales bacterium]|jgi:predicted nucleotidyltransferase|nr:hypothetical protein [Acholeplasmatales bacterium]